MARARSMISWVMPLPGVDCLAGRGAHCSPRGVRLQQCLDTGWARCTVGGLPVLTARMLPGHAPRLTISIQPDRTDRLAPKKPIHFTAERANSGPDSNGPGENADARRRAGAAGAVRRS